MRTMLILTLLISILLVSVAVVAEETNLSADKTTSMEIAVETEDATSIAVDGANATDQAETATNGTNLVPLFGSIHERLLISTEEAYAYLLMNHEDDKQAFLENIKVLEDDFASYEGAAKLNVDQMAVFKSGYEQVMAGSEKMTTAAEKMFASFEKEGKPVPEDVLAFEDEIDAVFNATTDAWMAYNESMGGASLPTDIESQNYLYNKLNSAIHESYAFPVIGDKVEKEDALANFAEFDELLAKFEEKYPEFSYDNLKTAKEEIMQAAETMFATYEKDGAVNAEEVAALEKVVDDYLKVIGAEPSEVTVETAEPVTAEANVTLEEGNTTATA